MQKLSTLPTKCNQRVMRQLVEAILFEEIIPIVETEMNDGWKLFRFQGNEATYQCMGKRSAFSRVRFPSSLLVCRDEGKQEIASITELIYDLPVSYERKEKILHELKQTILLSERNEALLEIPLSRRDLSYERLEAALVEGHPYHPCFKARTGFSIEDHERYGPEGEQEFQLIWLGIRKEDVAVSYPVEEHSFLQQELGHAVWKQVVQALCRQGGQLYDYRLVPIHPWQWYALKEDQFTEAILNKEILYLGHFGDAYKATQSLRTVMNQKDIRKAHVKLPLNVVNTSSLRSIAPHLIAAAPSISAWLKRIIDCDPFLKDEANVQILSEYAGAAYEPSGKPWNKAVFGQIGCIYRESIATKVIGMEQAVPFNALPLMEKDGELFVSPYLKSYGVEPWLKQLIEVSVIPVIHLLAKHGIALEAHAQNMVLVHEKGWPKRIILRDFHESLEYCKGFVQKPSWIPAFENLHETFKDGAVNEHYWMSSIEALRELLMDTLFVYQLSDLSWQIEVVYGYTETQFWQLVDRAIRKYIKKEIVPKERVQALGLDTPTITTESLFKRKLTAESVCSHNVRNELGKERYACLQ